MALTPMMRQYLDIKEKNKDCLLFFRLGDFYEMFFEDAKIASKELELTLTGKDCGLEERAPMCGIPYHAVDGYIAKLIDKGYKVAICEQLEDPAAGQGTGGTRDHPHYYAGHCRRQLHAQRRTKTAISFPSMRKKAASAFPTRIFQRAIFMWKRQRMVRSLPMC